MKRIFYAIASLFILSNTLVGQTAIDTVSTSAGYTDQVWYSLANDEQARSGQTDWDIAFSITGFSASIYANTAKGLEVYIYPNGDTATWDAVDTMGMNAWNAYHNDPTSWGKGAFNAGIDPEDDIDLGWGTYSFITHFVTGDSLFVLKMPNGSIQKLWIKQLASGVYTFRHASLDGMMDMTHSVAKADYENRNFAYYNLTTHSSSNPEPHNAEWDLLFTRYIDFIPVPYGVSGVLLNSGVEAIKAYPVSDPTTYDDYPSHSFVAEANKIGWDWKSFDFQNGWQIADSLVYFVKAKDETIWKIVFTEFGGSGNGNFIFEKTQITATSIDDLEAKPYFSAYPNPLNGNDLSIVLDYAKSDPDAEISLVDLQGRTLMREAVQLLPGLNQYPVRVPQLASGVYFLRLKYAGGQLSTRVVQP
ncbi:MAG: T9SS type A sorting domain-containing protein [Bacteroidota bacterium]